MALPATLPAPLERVRLETLAPGEAAIVDCVEGEATSAERLADLGFVPGTGVRVVRRSPLGDPSEYELRGYRLCLRRAEARRIQVRRLPPNAA